MKQDGHNIKWLGMALESTFGVNPIPDFTDGTPLCNPLIANIDGSFDISINDIEDIQSKSLNGFGAIGEGDFASGNFNYTAQITGNILKNGMGFVISPFFQVDAWDIGNGVMTYKVEDSDNTCPLKSYTLYFPVGCGTLNSGAVVTGAIPTSLSIDFNARTWTMTFTAKTYNTQPTPVMLPQLANYNIGSLTNEDFTIIKNKGKLTLNGTSLETKSLTLDMNYEVRDSDGMYDENGEMTFFVVGNHTIAVAYESDYDTVDSATNKSASWLASHKDKSKIENLGFVFNDTTNSFVGDFDGIKTGNSKSTPGSDLASFGTTFNSVGIPAQTMLITIKDDMGDITADI